MVKVKILNVEGKNNVYKYIDIDYEKFDLKELTKNVLNFIKKCPINSVRPMRRVPKKYAKVLTGLFYS